MCRRTPHKIQHRHEIEIIARGVALDDKHSRNIKTLCQQSIYLRFMFFAIVEMMLTIPMKSVMQPLT